MHSVYRASRAIERQGTDDVLAGIPDLVRAIMAPGKFSLFLLNGSSLSVSASEGWHVSDGFLQTIRSTSPLFQAMVASSAVPVCLRHAHESTLSGQGILAAPWCMRETGRSSGC